MSFEGVCFCVHLPVRVGVNVLCVRLQWTGSFLEGEVCVFKLYVDSEQHSHSRPLSIFCEEDAALFLPSPACFLHHCSGGKMSAMSLYSEFPTKNKLHTHTHI